MSDTPTPAEVIAISRRVQALSEDARSLLLYALVGRMLVTNPDALEHDIDDAERLEVAL